MTNNEIRELVHMLRELGVTEYESIGIKLKLGPADPWIATIPVDADVADPAPVRASLIDAMVGKPRAA